MACVSACVRVLDVHVCLDTCACVIQKSEEGVQCLTPPFFDLFFDTDTLTEPGALTIFLCSPHTPYPTVLGSREHSLTQLYMWCRDLNSGSRLHCKCSEPSYLLGPFCSIKAHSPGGRKWYLTAAVVSRPR